MRKLFDRLSVDLRITNVFLLVYEYVDWLFTAGLRHLVERVSVHTTIEPITCPSQY